jgi:hypothetical protein
MMPHTASESSLEDDPHPTAGGLDGSGVNECNGDFQQVSTPEKMISLLEK